MSKNYLTQLSRSQSTVKFSWLSFKANAVLLKGSTVLKRQNIGKKLSTIRFSRVSQKTCAKKSLQDLHITTGQGSTMKRKKGKMDFILLHQEFHGFLKCENWPDFTDVVNDHSHGFWFHRQVHQCFHARSIINRSR